MKSKRLKKVADYIDSTDAVIDVGCDHGYLAIYLKKEKKLPVVIATDIKESALSSARNNIKKANLESEIKTLVSDGLKSVPLNEIDTIIIAGMGAHTILNILTSSDLSNIKKIVLASNNDYPLLRNSMQKYPFVLKEEALVEENNHFYFIMKYVFGNDKLTEHQIQYGIHPKEYLSYYESQIKKQKAILKNLTFWQFRLRKDIKKEINELQSLWKD